MQGRVFEKCITGHARRSLTGCALGSRSRAALRWRMLSLGTWVSSASDKAGRRGRRPAGARPRARRSRKSDSNDFDRTASAGSQASLSRTCSASSVSSKSATDRGVADMESRRINNEPVVAKIRCPNKGKSMLSSLASFATFLKPKL